MRKMFRTGVAAALAVSLFAGGVRADSMQITEEREPTPFAAIGAAFLNLVFIPIRLGITVIGAELGGITGMLTIGNEEAASDVWRTVKGQNALTPDIMKGRESLRIGDMEFAGR